MDPELVAQTLNFHGQQLTKIWENERGSASLQANALRDLDYQVFQKRSKDLGYVQTSGFYFLDVCDNKLLIVFCLSFHERGKRMRLHQFIVDKASQLFKTEKRTDKSATSLKSHEGNSYVTLNFTSSFG